MKIKIFSDTILADKGRQKQIEKQVAKGNPDDDIEYRVNQFISGKKVIDIKTTSSGDSFGNSQIVITVIYEG
ncbi:hypothetical protein GYN67_10120 [Lactococcus piscium]|uniref:hypothetical protein n=1 Tax=Pseudolactococcus carnosus TaxID=2749961 RepID=UPI001FB9B8A9|nr:hypothetical protein [Lactococcus carnosus]MCJ1997042.1 hypothetical protein [Lactococcus carnosus]